MLTTAYSKALPLYNLHLETSAMTSGGFESLRRLQVGFDAPRSGYGGFESTVYFRDGKTAGINTRGFVANKNERAAAHAVLDAVIASGLLTQDLPTGDWRRPAIGRSRLYFDRRSRFVEFDTSRPPAVLQGILSAILLYRSSQ